MIKNVHSYLDIYNYDYSARSVSYVDAYGVNQSASIRYKSTYTKYQAVYSGAWEDLTSVQLGYESPKYATSTPSVVV
jgi:hypothetical protein